MKKGWKIFILIIVLIILTFSVFRFVFLIKENKFRQKLEASYPLLEDYEDRMSWEGFYLYQSVYNGSYDNEKYPLKYFTWSDAYVCKNEERAKIKGFIKVKNSNSGNLFVVDCEDYYFLGYSDLNGAFNLEGPHLKI
jgi:hypothetical protein